MISSIRSHFNILDLLARRVGALFGGPQWRLHEIAEIQEVKIPAPAENRPTGIAWRLAIPVVLVAGLATIVAGGAQNGRHLVWVDRQGNIERLAAPPHQYRHPRISPDGQRLALTIDESRTDIWLYEIAKNRLTRLTFEGNNQLPLWTPDGKRVLWRSVREGVPGNLFWKLADGSGDAEQLTTGEFRQNPGSWSPDGKSLAFYQRPANSRRGRDLWVLSLEKELEMRPLLQTQFNELVPQISPDGRWIAYLSDESGRNEIYVQPFPGLGRKRQISEDGGAEPLWAPNGRKLFFRNAKGDQMMVVDVSADNSFAASTPRLLFEGNYHRSATGARAVYDITPDGERFLMIQPSRAELANQANIVLNQLEAELPND